MSDRRPSTLYVWEAPYPLNVATDANEFVESNFIREATPADLLAVVRRGVESGTIKGKVEETVDCSQEHRGHSSMEVFDLDPGTYLVVGPVSDGGSET